MSKKIIYKSVFIAITLINFLTWHCNIFVLKKMFRSQIMSQYDPPIPIQHIWVKKHLVAMFWENIRLLSFNPHFSRVNTYYPTIMIFLYISLVECIPPLATKNNTLKI